MGAVVELGVAAESAGAAVSGGAGASGDARSVAEAGGGVIDERGVVDGVVVWGDVWARAEPAKASAVRVIAAVAARRVFMDVTVLLQRRCVTQALRWRGNTVEITSHSGHDAASGTLMRRGWRQNGAPGKAQDAVERPVNALKSSGWR